MTHAYVAKAAAAAAPFSGPTGWNINWPWPGAYPPGYAPSYSISGTGPLSVAVTDPTSSITSEIFDQEEYGTKEPESDITWSAKIGDTTVQLKFNEEDDFADSVNSSWTNPSEEWWSDAQDLIFDIGSGDIGETLTLTMETTMDDETVSGTHEMLIIADTVWTYEFEVTVTPSSGMGWSSPTYYTAFGTTLYINTGKSYPPNPVSFLGSVVGNYFGYSDGAWYYAWDRDPVARFTMYVNDTEELTNPTGPYTEETGQKTDVMEIVDGQIDNGVTYSIGISFNATVLLQSGVAYGQSITYDFSFAVKKNGVLQDSETQQIVKQDGDGSISEVEWLSLDGTTKVITVS